MNVDIVQLKMEARYYDALIRGGQISSKEMERYREVLSILKKYRIGQISSKKMERYREVLSILKKYRIDPFE